MVKTYTDEELIDELHRFVAEKGRVPKSYEMTNKNGYPSVFAYVTHFGSFNNALEIANLEINNKHQTGVLDGTEVCSYCNKLASEIPNFRQWVYINDVRYCNKHGQGSDYITGNLDKNSNTGKATISQRVVAKVLELSLKNDCNCSLGFNAPYDLFDTNKYNYINVKDSKLSDNAWHFGIKNKYTPDTYILVGFDKDRKNILKVWITDAVDDLVYNNKTGKLLTLKTITNSLKGLTRAQPWEVNSEPYNDMLHQMSLDKCSILKSETEEEKRKHEEFKKTYFKKLGIVE